MSQKEKLLELLQDGRPHRTDEIVDKVYGHGLSLARVGARIWDIKQTGKEIRGYKAPENPKLYYYQLLSNGQLL